MSDSTARAADFLAEARLARRRLTVIPESFRPADPPAAYQVQNAVHERLSAAGLGPVVGHKIGSTTAVMQHFLGIDTPCAGGILAAHLYHENATLQFTDFVRVGVECEIAVRLGHDLLPGRIPFSAAMVMPAVDACMAAIEIVDDRWNDYSKTDTPSLLADDFFAAGAVLGRPVVNWKDLDLTVVQGSMRVNGAMRGGGLGSHFMSHPFTALAWLANQSALRGKALRAGDVVMTGSVIETCWLSPGDEAMVHFSELGEATVRFTAPSVPEP